MAVFVSKDKQARRRTGIGIARGKYYRDSAAARRLRAARAVMQITFAASDVQPFDVMRDEILTGR
jgi:hypothetical protein